MVSHSRSVLIAMTGAACVPALLAGDGLGTPEIKQRYGMIVIKTYERALEIPVENR